MQLWTLGYQGLHLEEFLDLLQENGVEALVDVRETAWSHKPGFSGSALAAAAEARGIRYVHMRALGTPRDIRAEYKASQDWAALAARFNQHLESQDEPLAQLVELMRAANCCLVCFEADPQMCHRSLVAAKVEAMAGEPVTVTHLAAAGPGG